MSSASPFLPTLHAALVQQGVLMLSVSFQGANDALTSVGFKVLRMAPRECDSKIVDFMVKKCKKALRCVHKELEIRGDKKIF